MRGTPNPKLGLLWPVEWTTTYGKGRVYISTYGHVWPGDVDPPGLRDAAVQTIIPRALEWLARRPVTYPVPQDFPGASAVSLREHDSVSVLDRRRCRARAAGKNVGAAAIECAGTKSASKMES